MWHVRRLFSTILAVSAVSLGGAAAEVRAMFSYADWCGPCAALEPKLVEAIGKTGLEVELVYLDFTDLSVENRLVQFERAYPLSEDDFLEGGRFLKTGFAYVLADGDLVGEIRSTMATTEIIDILEDALRR
jgi:thiol-disulfide isomerase/thioredoxin